MHIPELGSDRVPMGLSHPVALDPQRVHGQLLEHGPCVEPRGLELAVPVVDARGHAFEIELELVRVARRFRELRRPVNPAGEDVLWPVVKTGERIGRQSPGVADHVRRQHADRARQAEVLRLLVGEDDDQLGLRVADVLEGVERTRWYEEHLPRRDREARVLVGVAEDGHEDLAAQAVARARWRSRASAARETHPPRPSAGPATGAPESESCRPGRARGHRTESQPVARFRPGGKRACPRSGDYAVPAKPIR